jgi:hypothetical protein
MKKFIVTFLTAFAFATPALADPEVKGWNSYDAMGCMLLRECTDEVKQVKDIEDLSTRYPDSDFSPIAYEFNEMLSALGEIGVKVFLASEKYFPPQHRGVYHTVGNNFFLNEDYMHKPHQLMSVMRHEGWHAAQDCMAGTIHNNFIAIIYPETKVPTYWRMMSEQTYDETSRPWEQEAMWAGHTENMTMNALKVCAKQPMWEVYPPTPLTREYLIKEGYIK